MGHDLVLLLPMVLLAALWAMLATHVRPAFQAFLAFAAGTLMVADATAQLVHAQDSGVGSSDLTGFAIGLAGLALIVAALAITLRPKARRSRARRWGARAGVVLGAIATMLFVTSPLYLALYASHKPAMDVNPASLPPGHRELTLRTADGIDLAASWVPPRNGAAVVLVHGSGGDRGGSIASRARSRPSSLIAVALPLYRVLTHAPTAPSLGDLVAQIAPRPALLISSGKGYEQQMNREYDQRAGRGTVLWEMPDAPHTGGLATHPVEYERRVVAFFDRALLGRS